MAQSELGKGTPTVDQQLETAADETQITADTEALTFMAASFLAMHTIGARLAQRPSGPHAGFEREIRERLLGEAEAPGDVRKRMGRVQGLMTALDVYDREVKGGSLFDAFDDEGVASVQAGGVQQVEPLNEGILAEPLEEIIEVNSELSVNEAARLAGVSPNSLYTAIYKGRLPASQVEVKSGKTQWRVNRQDIEEYVRNSSRISSNLE